MRAGAVRQMIALLERERALLLSHRVEDAVALAAEKMRLTDALEGMEVSRGEAAQIRALARRNGELIAAAKAGQDAARARMKTILEGATVRTYSVAGEPTTLGPRSGQIFRRA